MTTIKCPICKERVSAANTDDLNLSLREHLADVHDMRELTRGREEAYRTSYVAGPSTGRYVEREPTEREYREERREPRMSTTERMRESEPERESRWRYGGREEYPYVERIPEAGFNAPPTRTIREVETWTTRNPERFRTENYIPREEVRQWRYPVTGEYGERGPTSSGRMREERYERRSTVGERGERTSIVNCPMCGATLRGVSEDDLSDELRDHLADVHDIKPKMSARFRT